jgi:hypothetical protein
MAVCFKANAKLWIPAIDRDSPARKSSSACQRARRLTQCCTGRKGFLSRERRDTFLLRGLMLAVITESIRKRPSQLAEPKLFLLYDHRIMSQHLLRGHVGPQELQQPRRQGLSRVSSAFGVFFIADRSTTVTTTRETPPLPKVEPQQKFHAPTRPQPP